MTAASSGLRLGTCHIVLDPVKTSNHQITPVLVLTLNPTLVSVRENCQRAKRANFPGQPQPGWT